MCFWDQLKECAKVMLDILLDTLLDGLKLLPFLFITYLAMEYIEHKTSQRTEQVMKRSGKWGPVLGGVLGIMPQCGFSTAASNFYAGRIITLGTLVAVFLSTSDEMLPILISEQVNPIIIIRILAVKAVIGIITGLLVDFLLCSKKGYEKEELRIEHLCDHQHCHCGEGKIVKSALSHTLQIFVFILVITFALNLTISFVGEEQMAAVISNKPVLGPVISGLIGLIPNCASSVVLTQLYLDQVLSAGATIAGLLSGSGVGLLVLYRVNDDIKENVKITILLYAVGVVFGILIDSVGVIL